MKPPLPPDTTPRDTSGRLVDFRSLVSLVRSANTGADASLASKRKLLADLCRLFGEQVKPSAPAPKPVPAVPPPPPAKPTPYADLPPRRRQVLEALLKGQSEKEVAKALRLSVHTVHVHVKAIYKQFGVSSRAELMAACLTSK